MVVLVTGAAGQLGQSLQHIAPNFPEMEFIFATSSDLDITNSESVAYFFATHTINACINTAAYTAVDKAESEVAKAKAININGPENLAIACNQAGAILCHVSTDFVFDGSLTLQVAPKGYTETDATAPLGVYGQTKLEGELAVAKYCAQHYIVRTSWVYSEFGNNFMKTMLRLAEDRDTLNVVSDQIGTPTYAVDLAKALVAMLLQTQSEINRFGIYNFSNEGVCSWYDFAKEIFAVYQKSIIVNPIPTEAYPTPAKRPKFSLLDKTKIKDTFNLEIKPWQESLLQTKR